jgi:hypothetical protein
MIEPTPSDPIRSKEKLRSALGSTRTGPDVWREIKVTRELIWILSHGDVGVWWCVRRLHLVESRRTNLFVSACSDHTGRPDKSGPMALNQFRPSVPVWSETLWPTFITHVVISA